MHSLTPAVKAATQDDRLRAISTIAATITTSTAAWIAIETPLPLPDAAESIAPNRIEQPKKSARLQRMIFLSKVRRPYFTATSRLARGPC